MAPKKTLKNLSKKGINSKKASKVVGGMRKAKLAGNHNQTSL